MSIYVLTCSMFGVHCSLMREPAVLKWIFSLFALSIGDVDSPIFLMLVMLVLAGHRVFIVFQVRLRSPLQSFKAFSMKSFFKDLFVCFTRRTASRLCAALYWVGLLLNTLQRSSFSSIKQRKSPVTHFGWLERHSIILYGTCASMILSRTFVKYSVAVFTSEMVYKGSTGHTGKKGLHQSSCSCSQ